MKKEFIYGVNPVREAILSGKRWIFSLYYFVYHRDLIYLARNRGIKVIEVGSRKDVHRLSGTEKDQGVALEVSPYPYCSIEDLIKKKKENGYIDLLILDGVTDPGNLGSMIRSSYLLGFSGVVIPERRASGVTPVVVKSSAGATEWIDVAREVNIARSLRFLKKSGFWIVCATEKGEKVISDLSYDFNVALVMGDEGRGIRNVTQKECDFRVKIPLSGKQVGSLNVSVAAGIMMYEIKHGRG